MKRQMGSHHVKPSAVSIGGSTNKWHKGGGGSTGTKTEENRNLI